MLASSKKKGAIAFALASLFSGSSVANESIPENDVPLSCAIAIASHWFQKKPQDERVAEMGGFIMAVAATLPFTADQVFDKVDYVITDLDWSVLEQAGAVGLAIESCEQILESHRRK